MKDLNKTEKFIVKASARHDNKYTYDKVVYTKASEKVIITCPIHGDFEQRASTHLKGSGCQLCGVITASLKHRNSTESFILKARKIHGNKYDYSKTMYERYDKKVIIICPEHGEFLQTPGTHLDNSGCNLCAISKSPQMNIKSADTFIEDCFKAHGSFYDYSKAVYLGCNTKITIICPTHGEFEQTPSNHIRGNKCPQCSSYGFDPGKPAILYYLKITTNEGRLLYKIGVTNRTVNERFSITDLSKIEVVKQDTYLLGQDALDKEQEIIKKYKEYRYKGPNILESGNTELFTEDIRNV